MRFPLLLVAALLSTVTATEWYPLTPDGEVPSMVPYAQGQTIPLECTQRDVDNSGEHKFDDKMNILYAPFPVCTETGRPLSFLYGQDQNMNCTFVLHDELYHQFQYYVHEDAPFSCRVPVSNPDLAPLEKAYIPLRFNLRGNVQESHLDVDGALNVLFTSALEQNTPISSIAWSSSTTTNRYVIGDSLTLTIAVRWAHVTGLGSSPHAISGGFYPVSVAGSGFTLMELLLSIGVCCFLTGMVTYTLVQSHLQKKVRSMGYHYQDVEHAVGKRD